MNELHVALECLWRYGEPVPAAIAKCHHWRAIEQYSKRLFGHAEFTGETWQFLAGWCLLHKGMITQDFLGSRRSRIHGMLRRAFAKDPASADQL